MRGGGKIAENFLLVKISSYMVLLYVPISISALIYASHMTTPDYWFDDKGSIILLYYSHIVR